ncbi:MAG: glycosyltransferase [candidate division Zixibacteria bacterium]|nr:glycosyltransferase [candidate division Zixibacteria bacterium]
MIKKQPPFKDWKILICSSHKTTSKMSEEVSVNKEILKHIPIICYAEDWNRLPSSTQHLIRGLSKTHKVLWVDSLGLRTPSVGSGGDLKRIIGKVKKFFKGIVEVEPNIFELSPIVIPLYKYKIFRRINKHILKFLVRGFLRKNKIKEFIQWSSCPTSVIAVNAMGEKSNVYYIGDEFSEFTQFDSGLVGLLERELLIKSDILFVVSDKLVETKSQFNPLVYKIPHGCDFKHFSSTRNLSENDIPAELRKIKSPIVGYYGLIRDWFDFEMLREIFSRNKEWNLVLIGPSDTDTSVIEQLPNVHFLGPKPYEQLPRYIRGFDTCIIPYRKTEITINANPLKLLEYLASGKPIVTTDLPAVHQYSEGLKIASTNEEYEKAINSTLNDDSFELMEKRIQIARENSWDNRVDTIESNFEKHIYHFHEKDEKPVVMHLIAAMEIAGAEKVVLNLLSQRQSSKYDLRVTSFVRGIDGTGSKFLRAVTETDTIIDRIPMYVRWDVRDISALIRIIKRHNVKILHTHGYKSDIVGVIASKLTGVPLIATAHGFTNIDSNIQRNEKLDRFFLRFARKVLCVSDTIKDSLIRSGLSADNIEVLTNAVDFEYFTHDADIDFRKSWGVGDDEIIIGSAGRLSKEKAHVNMLEAVSLLPAKTKEKLKVVIAGDGSEKENIIAKAKELNIYDRLILPGFLSDMRSFYQAIGIFCLPSLTEGLPLSLLEAAASKTPVIASDVGYIGNLIENGIDGFTPPPGDIESLKMGLETLIDNRDRINSFGEQLNSKLIKDYDIEKWAQKIFAIYDEYVNLKQL